MLQRYNRVHIISVLERYLLVVPIAGVSWN